MDARRLDYFLVSLSIVVFAKMLASNCKLANCHQVARNRQIISGTNQLLSLKDKWGRNLPESALTSTLAHHTYETALLVPSLTMQARDAAGANAANTVGIFSKLFHTINTCKLLQTRLKPSREGAISRSSSHYVENKTGTKQQNEDGAKKIRKQSRI